MKCDELKPLLYSIRDLAYVDEPQLEPHFQNPHDHAVYKATEVDAAIAELKRKLQDQCISCPVKMQEDDVVAELKAENENLKNNLFVVETDIAMAARWRKVSEELPQNGQDVWAYDSISKRVLLLEYEKSDEGEGFICFPYKQDFYRCITHWMPSNKPKAPEETDK